MVKQQKGKVFPAEAFDALKKRWRGPQRRPCGDCTACCTYFELTELNKKGWEPCCHLGQKGCTIWAKGRPPVCEDYACAYAMGYGKRADRPDKSGVIVDLRKGMAGHGLYGHVTREPDEKTMRALERISEEAGVDVYLELKKEGEKLEMEK